MGTISIEREHLRIPAVYPEANPKELMPGEAVYNYYVAKRVLSILEWLCSSHIESHLKEKYFDMLVEQKILQSDTERQDYMRSETLSIVLEVLGEEENITTDFVQQQYEEWKTMLSGKNV